MRRESDKYQFKEPFGRDIRKKMIESQKRTLQGPEKFLKLGQLKPTQLATVGHVASGVFQPDKKPAVPAKSEKRVKNKEHKKSKKTKKSRKRPRHDKAGSEDEDKKSSPVDKKGKKGETSSKNSVSSKKISDISLAEFDNIRKKFPGNPKTNLIDSLARTLKIPLTKSRED